MSKHKIQKSGVLIIAVAICCYAVVVCVVSLRSTGGISPLFFAVDGVLLMLACLLLYACRTAEQYGRWGWHRAINKPAAPTMDDRHHVVVTDSAQHRDLLLEHEHRQKVSASVLRTRVGLAEKLPFLLATDHGWRHLHTLTSLVYHPMRACLVKGLWKELFGAQAPVLTMHICLDSLLSEGQAHRLRKARHLARVWHMIPEGTRPLRVEMVLLGQDRTGVGKALAATLEPGDVFLLTPQMSREEVLAHLTETMHGYVDRAVGKADPDPFLDLVEAASHVSRWGRILADYSDALFSCMQVAELSWRYTDLLPGGKNMR
ncbi:hypothetical protein [Desulfoluna spongiiphila]|uniref:hypothetical protein n=1 Tax=Desulfoluna spongiiphila TaxID=419481 RepID=UPI001250F6D0|nr:hypothetical protein [Desulfoluna spongiiphila]VVS95584.1 hypothetical protein DBB_51610 [Desulfoluna spongiiphila]